MVALLWVCWRPAHHVVAPCVVRRRQLGVVGGASCRPRLILKNFRQNVECSVDASSKRRYHPCTRVTTTSSKHNSHERRFHEHDQSKNDCANPQHAESNGSFSLEGKNAQNSLQRSRGPRYLFFNMRDIQFLVSKGLVGEWYEKLGGDVRVMQSEYCRRCHAPLEEWECGGICEGCATTQARFGGRFLEP